MLNSYSNAGTADDSSIKADTTSVRQTIAKPHVEPTPSVKTLLFKV